MGSVFKYQVCPHHTENYSASYNVACLKAILNCVGMEPERIRLERISVVKAPRLVQAVADLTEEMRKLDPSRLRKKGGKDG